MLSETNATSYYEGLLYNRFKSHRVVKVSNQIIYSENFYVVLAALCAFAFMFSQELLVYTIYVIAIILILLIGKRIDRFLMVIPFFYIAPSVIHNPAVFEDSIFLNNGCLIYLGVLASVPIVLFCVVTVRAMTHRRKAKPNLRAGYIMLGVAYICSGLFSSGASLKNLVFALVEFISISALYFVGYYVMDDQADNKGTFAKIGVSIGLVLCIEVLDIYLFSSVFARGYLNRGNIYTGWGIHNNLGNMLCFCIPSAFYMLCNAKRKIGWLVYACTLMLAVVLTTSRGSILTGLIILVLSLIVTITMIKQPQTVRRIVWTVCTIVIATLISFVYLWTRYDFVKLTVEKIIRAGLFNDSGRFAAWGKGIDQFVRYPIFGKGFYECSSYLYGDGVAGLLPARWHNTIIQLLASCGIVGLVAYLFHRLQTIRLLFKNKTPENCFIALSILAILLGSFTDNHFFNIGPGIVYGMFLAFAETNVSSTDGR